MDGGFNLPLIISSENSLKHQKLQIALPLPVTLSLYFSQSSLHSLPESLYFTPHLLPSVSPPIIPCFLLEQEYSRSLALSSAFFPPLSLSVVCDAEKPSGLNLSLLFIISAITANAGSPSLLQRVSTHSCVGKLSDQTQRKTSP